MNHLPEILRVVADLRDPKLEIIDETRDKDSVENISKLYYGFKTGKFTSDQIAAQEIYQSPQTETRYTTLKSRLQRRLLNSLFLLDLKRKKYSENTQATYRCNKRLFVSKSLILLGARSSAIRIAESTLVDAIIFQLTSVEIELLLILREHASLKGDLKSYNASDASLKLAIRTLEAETISRECYERFALEFGSSEEVKIELADRAKEFYARLEVLRDDSSSFVFMINYFRVKYFMHEYKQDVKGMLIDCDDALKFLASKPRLSFTVRVGEFALKQLHCYLLLNDYEQGFATVQHCSTLFPKGSNNWFVYNEHSFLLAMNTQHFIEAEGIYKEVVEHPRFESLAEQRKEKWRIFELYLKYALLSIPAAQAITGAERPQVRIKTFLRSVPNYARDKRGLNISILVLQILYLLESEDFDGIINRMESLRTYRTRYLKSSSNRQSAIFFKLLQVMENNSFSYKLTREKSKKYYDRLLETTVDSTDTSEGIQILPFDWLWEHILDRLKEIEERHRQTVTSIPV